MKRCPFCAEEIQDAAVLCRFCGRELEPARAQGASLARFLRGAELGLGLVTAAAVAYLVIGRTGWLPERSVAASALVDSLAAEPAPPPPPPPYVLALLDSEVVDLPAGEHYDTVFTVADPYATEEPRPCTFTARVRGLSGGGRDVEVFLLDEHGYESWHSGESPLPLFESGRSAAAELEVPLPGAGRYVLLLSNRYSLFTDKTVEVERAEVRCEAAVPSA